MIFSSRLLDEVERVSDHVAMLHQGTLRLCAPLEEIKSRYRRVSLRFELPRTEPPQVAGAIHVNGAGREWTIISDAARLPGFSVSLFPIVRLQSQSASVPGIAFVVSS